MNLNPVRLPLNILLVEDSPTDVIMTREALRSNKALNRLFVVEDGVEAMAFLRRHDKHAQAPRPHLILLDLNLPRKSGLEVLAEMKTDAMLKSIPVIVLTTSQAEEDVVKSYRYHANCYITKPVDFAEFVEDVRSLNEFWFNVVTLPPEIP